MSERPVRYNDKDVPRLFATHLGGGVMHARLRQKGWSDNAIGDECVRLINEEREAIDRYCDLDLEKVENVAWRNSILYHTAMQILNEREGVAGDELRGREARKQAVAEAEAEREPIDSWYDTEIDDFDDLD